MGGNFATGMGEKDGRKGMGEKDGRKSMGENFVNSTGEKKMVKKIVWVKTL